ncbi:hypothetical protein BDY17DRAFT_103318 [Neohortaea acidophila]|uniref:GPI anchored protein n=1 Tax=Neohortaea acidophila TaxID=245834 RepID=A0A6A6PZJ6_9PEZI|nr:uncharacterized protein BDY17DRAFT_103318 [Neohortaea acidophila]KAF2485442.1 hypothetical protein BDY17DRAFT_103318 [Neohortaea acidophila]
MMSVLLISLLLSTCATALLGDARLASTITHRTNHVAGNRTLQFHLGMQILARQSCPQTHNICSSGTCCPKNSTCCAAGCMDSQNICCGSGACPPGNGCCGPASCRPPGWDCCGNDGDLYPTDGSECCSDGGYCGPEEYCGPCSDASDQVCCFPKGSNLISSSTMSTSPAASISTGGLYTVPVSQNASALAWSTRSTISSLPSSSVSSTTSDSSSIRPLEDPVHYGNSSTPIASSCTGCTTPPQAPIASGHSTTHAGSLPTIHSGANLRPVISPTADEPLTSTSESRTSSPTYSTASDYTKHPQQPTLVSESSYSSWSSVSKHTTSSKQTIGDNPTYPARPTSDTTTAQAPPLASSASHGAMIVTVRPTFTQIESAAALASTSMTTPATHAPSVSHLSTSAQREDAKGVSIGREQAHYSAVTLYNPDRLHGQTAEAAHDLSGTTSVSTRATQTQLASLDYDHKLSPVTMTQYTGNAADSTASAFAFSYVGAASRAGVMERGHWNIRWWLALGGLAGVLAAGL